MGSGTQAASVALLDYLAIFAQACRLKIADEDLVRDAHPAGRDEAYLQRIYLARRACDWRLDPDPATRTPPPPAVMEAVNDKEFRRAMGARDLLACRKVVPDVFEAVLPLVCDSDPAVRTSAMTAAASCLDHAGLGERKAALAGLMADAAAVSPEPRERAAIARLLGMLGYRRKPCSVTSTLAYVPAPRSHPDSSATSVPPANWCLHSKHPWTRTAGSLAGCPARRAGSTVTSPRH